MGLATKEKAKRRKAVFFAALIIEIAIFSVIFIGIWSNISDYKTAFIYVLILLETMNWYSGILMDEIWVRFSKFRVIKGTKDIPHFKKLPFVISERLIMSVIYVPVAAWVAKLAVMI